MYEEQIRQSQDRLIQTELGKSGPAWRLWAACVAHLVGNDGDVKVYLSFLAKKAKMHRSKAGPLMKQFGQLDVFTWDAPPRGAKTISRLAFLRVPEEVSRKRSRVPEEGASPNPDRLRVPEEGALLAIELGYLRKGEGGSSSEAEGDDGGHQDDPVLAESLRRLQEHEERERAKRLAETQRRFPDRPHVVASPDEGAIAPFGDGPTSAELDRGE